MKIRETHRTSTCRERHNVQNIKLKPRYVQSESRKSFPPQYEGVLIGLVYEIGNYGEKTVQILSHQY